MTTHLRNRSPSPQGRSFLSRLKSPFGAKARTPEFYIQLDEPHRQYSPGDVVSGSVVLKVSKAIRITHLVVKLHGYVQVYKAPNNPGEGYKTYSQALAQGKTRRGGGYYGNGIAALFEDEVVLCGDGRLEEGTYQFNYELEMPRTPLPSSIDFERGIIHYLVSATLTKPTTIAPTLSCEASVQFQERIDIAKLQKPKPRIISLEPIKRRGRSRRQVPTLSSVSDGAETRVSGESGDATQASEPNTSPANSDTEPPISPSPSRRSLESARSSNGVVSLVDSNSISGRTGDSKMTSSRHLVHSPKKMRSITAKIELQQAGYLQGDNGFIHIGVTHTSSGAPTKPGKSVHGAIITLYRQARVDYQPALTRVNIGKSEDVDASPKRMNGSVGLSVSQGTKSHLFRKDLSQTFVSLVINPSTLKAEIRAAVRIPEHVFPTISNVPGAMISFRYYIEVVLDLQNKLAGLDRFLPNAGMSGISTQAASGSGIPGASQSSFAWGGHCIDTEEIRRDKSVVSCVFEVVIGTADSERKSRWKQMAGPSDTTSQSGEDRPDEPASSISTMTDNIPTYDEHVAASGSGAVNGQRHDRNQKMPVADQPPPAVDPPEHHAYPIPAFIAEEQGLSEKERMRRAEARLLPSQPPGDDAEAGASSVREGPSAPGLYEDNDMTPSGSYTPTPSTMNGFIPPPNGYHGQYRFSHFPEAGPSAPAYEDLRHAGSNMTPTPMSGAQAGPSPTEDKQELQRHQLEQDRSAPPGEVASVSAGPAVVVHPAAAPETESTPSAPNLEQITSPDNGHEPSAPTMEELSLGFSPHGIYGDMSLPRYER